VEKDGAKAGRADACSQEESFFWMCHKQMNYPRYPEDQLINHKQIPPTISGPTSHEKHREQRCSEDFLPHPLHHWGDSMVESVMITPAALDSLYIHHMLISKLIRVYPRFIQVLVISISSMKEFRFC